MKVTTRAMESSAAAWTYRALLGPAMILDGIIALLTVGTVSIGLSLEVARCLSRARLIHVSTRHQSPAQPSAEES